MELKPMRILIAVAACLWCVGIAVGAQESKPNVLLVVVDDLRDHEMFAGANKVAMPNLDRLAARGVKFSHAYCQATFCNPSRTSFITGLRPNTTGVALPSLMKAAVDPYAMGVFAIHNGRTMLWNSMTMNVIRESGIIRRATRPTALLWRSSRQCSIPRCLPRDRHAQNKGLCFSYPLFSRRML